MVAEIMYAKWWKVLTTWEVKGLKNNTPVLYEILSSCKIWSVWVLKFNQITQRRAWRIWENKIYVHLYLTCTYIALYRSTVYIGMAISMCVHLIFTFTVELLVTSLRLYLQFGPFQPWKKCQIAIFCICIIFFFETW